MDNILEFEEFVNEASNNDKVHDLMKKLIVYVSRDEDFKHASAEGKRGDVDLFTAKDIEKWFSFYERDNPKHYGRYYYISFSIKNPTGYYEEFPGEFIYQQEKGKGKGVLNIMYAHSQREIVSFSESDLRDPAYILKTIKKAIKNLPKR